MHILLYIILYTFIIQYTIKSENYIKIFKIYNTATYNLNIKRYTIINEQIIALYIH